MINRLNNLKRKLLQAQEEQDKLFKESKARLEHLNDLFSIPSLADVKYEEWSKVRLNRLLVDYLLRKGYMQTAQLLAKEKGIEDLVDIDVFVQCHRVETSLKSGSTAEALTWCKEHAPLMKKTNTSLEFELRFQQYIELVRESKLVEARQHAQKWLQPHMEAHSKEIHQAAGMVTFAENTFNNPYSVSWTPKYRCGNLLTICQELYSQARWDKLAAKFVETHHEVFSIPPQPLLLTALSAGLSALKTPSCHSAHTSSSSNARSSTTTVCPICSVELNELARDVPYAHHSKSSVENDPVVLPNGRVYGRERLMQFTAKSGLEQGKVKDPTTLEVFEESKIKKVFIS